jgi:hypothetical protein
MSVRMASWQQHVACIHPPTRFPAERTCTNSSSPIYALDNQEALNKRASG